MPLFEYRCAQCQHLEEVLQKHGEPAPEVCPSCGAQNALEKEVSLTSFQLKGGGWYKDLYSSSPSSTSGSSDAASASAASSTSTSTKSADATGGGDKSAPKAESSASKDTATKSTEKKSAGKVA